ncbi:MAG: hypothetical protein NVS3B1_27970 [Marmoricola sp.]
MKFILTISTDNDAFEGESLGLEIERILREAAVPIGRGEFTRGEPLRLRDSNGNRVGYCMLEEG